MTNSRGAQERYAVDVKRLVTVKVLGEGAFGKAAVRKETVGNRKSKCALGLCGEGWLGWLVGWLVGR